MIPRPTSRQWIWIIAIVLLIVAIFVWRETTRAAVAEGVSAQQQSPTPSCAPDQPARVMKAVSPDVPASMRNINFRHATAIVNVTVDAAYAAAIINCVPAPGTYAFRAEVNQL